MGILEDFAEAMTRYEQSKGIPGGYRMDGKAPYPFYMSNEAWNAMLNEMSESVKNQFGAGSGGELEEKDGKPPKMAAFFSSSRMMYLLSKEWSGFEFEKKMPTYVGGVANLDGYHVSAGRTICVEAKCREIYGHKSPERVSDKYLEVYRFLAEAMPQVFDFRAVSLENGWSNVEFFCQGHRVEGFDLKQMICHLLAIAGSLLREEKVPERLIFLYVIYDPCNLPLKPESRERILQIHARTMEDAKNLDMVKMFGHIVDYLVLDNRVDVKADLDKVKQVFSYIPCSHLAYAIMPF